MYTYFREINTEDGINFDSFIEELRLVSMTNNEHFRDAFCDPSRSNNANTFHDEGKKKFSVPTQKSYFFENSITLGPLQNDSFYRNYQNSFTLSMVPWKHKAFRLCKFGAS